MPPPQTCTRDGVVPRTKNSPFNLYASQLLFLAALVPVEMFRLSNSEEIVRKKNGINANCRRAKGCKMRIQPLNETREPFLHCEILPKHRGTRVAFRNP